MSRDWLVLRFEAPLMAFGGEAVDQVGPTRDFPAASMLTGLFANAMGWHWAERKRHQLLQERLIFGAAIMREGRRLTDGQNARLYEDEGGWTTWGLGEARKKSPSYGAREQTGRKYLTHRRRRDYLVDAAVLVVLRLEPETEEPGIEVLATALERPARPLFIGRKPCLPSAPLCAGRAEGQSAYDALIAAGALGRRAQWPEGEGPEGDQLVDLADIRSWQIWLHGGSRRVVLGRIV